MPNALSNVRPRGEIRVELCKTPMRFGLELHMAVVGESNVWFAQASESGVVWQRAEDGLIRDPLMVLDEDLADAMYRALAQNPRPVTHLDRVYDHLADSLRQRDRVMDLLENTLERQHTLDLRATDQPRFTEKPR